MRYFQTGALLLALLPTSAMAQNQGCATFNKVWRSVGNGQAACFIFNNFCNAPVRFHYRYMPQGFAQSMMLRPGEGDREVCQSTPGGDFVFIEANWANTITLPNSSDSGVGLNIESR